MVWKVSFLLLFAFLLAIPLVSSAQPQTFINPSVGLSVEHPIADPIQANKSHEFHFHLYNRSDGRPLLAQTPTCSFHLYNQSGWDIYINDSIVNESLYDWKAYIGGGNFSSVGDYAFLFQCYTTTLGGFYSHDFTVVSSDKQLNTPRAIIYSSLLFLFVLIMIGLGFMISLLPKANERDEEGKMISISWLKYLRGSLWFAEYMLFVAILYLSSNIAYGFLEDNLFANVLFGLYRASFVLAPVILIIWIVWIFAKIFQDRQFWGMIQRGMFPGGRL